jgi:hypothetical protein
VDATQPPIEPDVTFDPFAQLVLKLANQVLDLVATTPKRGEMQDVQVAAMLLRGFGDEVRACSDALAQTADRELDATRRQLRTFVRERALERQIAFE